MLDNVVNLAVLAGILVAGFGFPAQLVYTRMFPGTALGVMFGDIVYTVMAIRLARRTGRSDVTAMPLGLDAPSTIGMALTVLGPAFVVAKGRMPVPDAAILAWQVGMATMVLMGVCKLICRSSATESEDDPRSRPVGIDRRCRHRPARHPAGRDLR
jgi:AGZA family xanthine/uracil permease-like MFS transporter